MDTAATSDFLDQIWLEQEHDSMLRRYWRHAYGHHTDYNVLTNDLGDFLMYKEKLYILQSLTKTILREYHNAHGYYGQTRTQKMILE